MQRRTVAVAVGAAVGIISIAAAAATLTSTVTLDQDTGVGTGGDGSGGDGVGVPPPADGPVDTVDVPLLSELLAVVLFIAVLAAIAYALYNWRLTLQMALAVALFLGLFALFVYFVSTLFATDASSAIEAVAEPEFGEENGSDGGVSGTLPVWTVLVVLAILAGLIALSFGARQSAISLPGSDSDQPDAGIDAETNTIGRTAGTVADRIEDDGSFENEIYRAWQEMTTQLEVTSPESTTPQEFATAAIDAGMNPDNVRTLTRLFEDVRYGDYTPTTEREQRAVQVFRRIEDTYASDSE